MNLLSHNGCTTFLPHFISEVDAALLFDRLQTEIQWLQDHISMYGRSIPIPRLTAWYGDAGNYTYSGITMTPHPWNAALSAIKQRVEASTGAEFNSVLLNLYKDGSHSVSWHSDDEPELGTNPTIASISLGETRTFHLRHNQTREAIKLDLNAGSLLVMSGETQHHWQHQVPKTKRSVQPRINLTFRNIQP